MKNRFLVRYSFIAFSVVLFVAISCKPTGFSQLWVEGYQRSARPDIDIFLVPKKYALLQTKKATDTYSLARFDKKQLESELSHYSRSIQDLQSSDTAEYKEDGDTVSMKVGRVTHSTAYDYDTEIPLAFFGKWFDANKHNQVVYQQEIAPTLASLMGVSMPETAKLGSLNTKQLKQSNGSLQMPDIVVVAVIDQGGRNLLKLHSEVAPNIHSLIEKSDQYAKAKVGHLDAHTAVGHAAIGTGAFPMDNSIISNTYYWIERQNGQSKLASRAIYAGKDESKVDSSEMTALTLADQLNRAYNGKSVIVSQSYALRAAIGMGGHGALNLPAESQAAIRNSNFIYWLDSNSSHWITDSRYYSVPSVARASDPLLQFTKYYPTGFAGYQIRDRASAKKNWGTLMATAAEAELEGELIRAVIQSEIIAKNKDKDGVPDLVYVSFKSADAVGHKFGYQSLEAKETLATIDEQIGKLIDFLKENYNDRFVLVLTADHGSVPLSEITGGLRLSIEEVINQIDSLLPADVTKNHSLVKMMTVAQISLNHDLMQEYGITDRQVAQKIMDITVNNQKFFAGVLTRQDLNLKPDKK
ncbi:MAG: alkaline phosphatase family protein [Leptonema sp. (in: Bacteria)]|nr:alkaline phosphatase family protein [Leptonema sp. (in: bacteria)]